MLGEYPNQTQRDFGVPNMMIMSILFPFEMEYYGIIFTAKYKNTVPNTQSNSGNFGKITKKLKPCPGDPVKNPQIAPQKVSGIKEGMFG